jgi:hypothetical protein
MCPNDGERGGLGWSIHLDWLPDDCFSPPPRRAAAVQPGPSHSVIHGGFPWLCGGAGFPPIILMYEAHIYPPGGCTAAISFYFVLLVLFQDLTACDECVGECMVGYRWKCCSWPINQPDYTWFVFFIYLFLLCLSVSLLPMYVCVYLCVCVWGGDCSSL